MGLPRLSRPHAEMRPRYTVVVVGSGYGGSITASRLARAGQSVALLERGRELHPGDFPRTAESATREVQLTEGSHHIGDRRSLYSFAVGADMNVLHGIGLGGTSLINANVSLEPADYVLADDRWPAALRADTAGLAAGYADAREMLRPTTYPTSFPPLAKVRQLQRAAGGDECVLTPINVNFRRGINHVGVFQDACNGCGDCVTGCNEGAKNTLLMNYLPDAVQHGAEIFTEAEVRWVERTGDHWTVWFQPLGTGREAFHAPPQSVAADVVVLAAGTLGTNGILLRSRERGLSLSDRLGERFTGNGDMLGYAYGLEEPVRGVGVGPDTPSETSPPGPCITAVVDDRQRPDRLDDAVIEDAVIPGAIGGLVPALLAPQLLRDWIRRKLPYGSGPISLLQSAVSHGHRGVINRTQTYLMMGIDEDSGRVVLRGDEPTVEWPGAGSRPYAVRADERMAAAAAAAGGTYVRNPIFTKELHHRVITVHPLGGCVMADDATGGVVDHRGRAFAGQDGDAVHDGLYVSDGSVVPLPLGVNPLFTISALAERTANHIAADHGWTIDRSLRHPDPRAIPPSPPQRPGLHFSERMSGFIALGDDGIASPVDLDDVDVFENAARAGEAAGTRFTFSLTLSTDDARAILARLDAPMDLDGTVEAPDLSPLPMTVHGGRFQLFAQDDPDPQVRHMWYRFPMTAVDGSTYFVVGYKIIAPGTFQDAWAATTTLYTTVHRDSADGPIVARGVLRIAPEDFRHQLRTMSTTGPVSLGERAKILSEFGAHFAGAVLHEYGHFVQHTYSVHRPAAPRAHRPLVLPAPEVHPYRALDGTDLRLTRYRGGDRGPVVLSHGMGANPLTFTLDTIHQNLVEYLVAHGFDVWVQEWRGSTALPTCRTMFTADQVARLDHPAAEAYVRAATGRHELHWVAHCVGSITATMSTLLGTITPASMLCSAASMHTVSLPVQRGMVKAGAPKLLKLLGVRFLNSNSYDDESLRSKLLDQVLRVFPVAPAERCDQAVCRRLAFIYGDAIHHAAVDDVTHLTLHELFGPSNLTMMTQLGNCAAAGHLVDAHRRDTYMDRVAFMDLPVTFLHGAKNLVWLPESTEQTYTLLTGRFGPDKFRRVVVADFGHQDVFIGARAPEVVFPEVLAHLDRVGA